MTVGTSAGQKELCMAMDCAPSMDCAPATVCRRKKWSQAPQQLFLPTGSFTQAREECPGDYVLLAPAGSPPNISSERLLTPPLPPLVEPKSRKPVPRLVPAALKHVPRPVPIDPSAQLVGLLKARPIAVSNSAAVRDGGHAQALTSAPHARSEAREASVHRLRNRVRKADADLAEALAESGRIAIQRQAQEQAELDAAIAASLHMEGGADLGGGGISSSSRSPGLTSRSGASGGHRAAKQTVATRSRPTLHAVCEEGGPSVIPSAEEAEEAHQLAQAIAESLQTENRRQADDRHNGEQVLYGIVDSLRDAPPISSGGRRLDAARSTSREPPAAAAAAFQGRDLARHILEAHLVSGGGL